MSKAAERVHVSQPALSRQIRLLEEEIGSRLFDRIKQRIHLTDTGKFFLLKAQQLLCDAEMALQQTQEQFVGAKRTLRLGFLSPFLDDLIAPVVREFQQRHARSKVSLFDLSPRAQLDRLRLRELDLGILANIDDEDKKYFDVRTLSRHKFIAVIPADHRLANRKALKLGDLKSESWISLANSYFPKRREFLIETCQKAGFNPSITAEMDSLPMMLVEIGTGGGVGLMPAHAAKLPHHGCVLIPISSPAIYSELFVILPKQNSRSAEMETLIALIEERAEKI